MPERKREQGAANPSSKRDASPSDEEIGTNPCSLSVWNARPDAALRNVGMRKICCLLVLLLAAAGAGLRAADNGGTVHGMSVEPSSTRVAAIGKARLSVEPLTRDGGSLQAPYKVEVTMLPTGSEEGKFSLAVSDADLAKLAARKSVQFSGQAVSKDGNISTVQGTASPTSGDEGALKIRVVSKKGKLVFHTKYHLLK